MATQERLLDKHGRVITPGALLQFKYTSDGKNFATSYHRVEGTGNSLYALPLNHSSDSVSRPLWRLTKERAKECSVLLGGGSTEEPISLYMHDNRDIEDSVHLLVEAGYRRISKKRRIVARIDVQVFDYHPSDIYMMYAEHFDLVPTPVKYGAASAAEEAQVEAAGMEEAKKQGIYVGDFIRRNITKDRLRILDWRVLKGIPSSSDPNHFPRVDVDIIYDLGMAPILKEATWERHILKEATEECAEDAGWLEERGTVVGGRL